MGPEADGTFDLVYLLSVYTHLDRAPIAANLARVSRLLRPGGLLVFTTHGLGSAAQLARYEQYWLDEAAVHRTLGGDGFYYARYPYYYAEYGLTWMREDVTRGLVARHAPRLHPLAHWPVAVDGHQDVFVYQAR